MSQSTEPVATAHSAAAISPAAAREAAAVEADLVAAAVLGCPGVVRLDGGGLRQVATYLPGRRVVGVRADDARIQVAVVAAAGVALPTVAAQVRAALAPLAGGRAVDVHIADVAVPGEAPVAAASVLGARRT